ncbi:MAG: STAS domain-containing protein [Firmicutes bacterium]|nr:STAS domain-containing protein [Candidatus Colivicinus equi]
MEINKTIEGDSLIIALTGRLDTTTAPELETELKSSIEGVKTLTLDFANLEYISSAGLRVLLAAQKIMNTQGEMSVINVNDEIKEVFDITGFNDILTVK